MSEREHIKLKKNESMKRYLILLALIAILFMANIVWIIGASKYKIIRCRFDEGLTVDNKHQLLVFGLGTEVNELTSDTIWYYNFIGGAYFPDSSEGKNNTNIFMRDYFQKLYIDDIYEYIYIVMLWNETADGTTLLMTKKVTLYQSTQIVITKIVFHNEEISIDKKELNWLLEAYFNFV